MPLAKGAIDATLPLSVARASHVLGQTGTVRPRRTSKTVWTKPKRCGLKALNPDDPAVIAAINLVRWELSLGI